MRNNGRCHSKSSYIYLHSSHTSKDTVCYDSRNSSSIHLGSSNRNPCHQQWLLTAQGA